MNAEFAYLFRHALLRDAAYSLQPPGARAKLHLLAADLLEAVHSAQEAPPPAEEIAAHLCNARDGRDEPELLAREIKYARMAAEQAEKGYRHGAAAHWWLHAAGGSTGADKGRCEVNAGQALIRQGRASDGERWLRQGMENVRLAGDLRTTAVAADRLAFLLANLARRPESDALHKEALKLARQSEDAELQMTVRTNRASNLMKWRDFEQAEAMLQEVLAETQRLGETSKLVGILNNLGALCKDAGRVAEAEAWLRRAIDVQQAPAQRAYRAHALGNLAAILEETGRESEAEPLYLSSLQESAARGERILHAGLGFNYSLWLSRQGRESEAEEYLRAGIEITTEAGYLPQLMLMLNALGTLLRRRGDVAGAEEKYRQTIAMARRESVQAVLCNALANLGDMLAETGRQEEGEVVLRECMVTARAAGQRRFEGIAAGNLARVLGRTGRTPEAELLFAQAQELHAAVRNVRSAALHLRDLALMLLAIGREHDARNAWARAEAVWPGWPGDSSVAQQSAQMQEVCRERGCPPLGGS